MALVIVSGLPSSGRTARCQELVADWKRRLDSAPSSSSTLPSRIVHLTDATVHLPKFVYASQRDEKPARASYLSLVSRSLVKDAIVIADGGAGLNIKGFRYQLWCAAREVGLTCTSIFVNTSKATCSEWNERRRQRGEEAYEPETINDLFMRYEEPNAMTRWDSPLFILSTETFDAGPRSDAEAEPGQKEKWEEPPYEQIWQAVTQGKVSKAPNVVIQNRTTSTNYLAVLETSTQCLLTALLSHQTTIDPLKRGGPVVLSPTLPDLTIMNEVTLSLPEGKGPPTAAQLQRLRRQFVKIHSSSFASNNVLGKTAKEEGGGQGSTLRRRNGGDSGGGAAGSEPASVIANKVGVPAGDIRSNDSLEESIVRRFAAWLGEILEVGA